LKPRPTWCNGRRFSLIRLDSAQSSSLTQPSVTTHIASIAQSHLHRSVMDLLGEQVLVFRRGPASGHVHTLRRLKRFAPFTQQKWVPHQDSRSIDKSYIARFFLPGSALRPAHRLKANPNLLLLCRFRVIGVHPWLNFPMPVRKDRKSAPSADNTLRLFERKFTGTECFSALLCVLCISAFSFSLPPIAKHQVGAVRSSLQ